MNLLCNKLSNGIIMPSMAIGTNWMNYKELYPIIRAGLEAGFRAIDTARDYGNEPVVGAVLKDVLQDLGMKRNEIFITTKIGNGQQIKGNIEEQLNISLRNLQTSYIDLWLMHWPYPGYFVETWKKMEELYGNGKGKIKAIGVANYQERHFKELLSNNPKIVPMVNQMEYHPLRAATSLVHYMKEYKILLQSYAPLCRLISPLKDAEVFKRLQNKYGKSIGQIILRWHIQQESMPVFKSYKPSRFKENIDIFDFELTDDEMHEINALDIDYKYHLESASCPGY